MSTTACLSQAELDYFVDAAIARWAEAGLSPEQLAALEAMDFTVADMSGLYLGSFSPSVITIDADAAGSGWFLDATPLEDSEFGNVLLATQLQTDPSGSPAGHYDLLTTLMHEMGHTLGLEDSYDTADRGDLMYGWLFTGERRLPGQGEADDAITGSITTEEFLGSPIQIGVLPPGKTVTIQWQATVVDPVTGQPQTDKIITDPVNSGTASATNGGIDFPDASTNTVTTVLDDLVLGGNIFKDADSDGTFDAGEGVVGVALTLYADTNNNGVFDAGVDLAVAGGTTITGADGVYSFSGATGLAEGDYILQVNESNFGVGGALDGLLSIADNPDPDFGNIDHDDNGERVAGQGAVTQAITLAFNTEPTSDGGVCRRTTSTPRSMSASSPIRRRRPAPPPGPGRRIRPAASPSCSTAPTPIPAMRLSASPSLVSPPMDNCSTLRQAEPFWVPARLSWRPAADPTRQPSISNRTPTGTARPTSPTRQPMATRPALRGWPRSRFQPSTTR